MGHQVKVLNDLFVSRFTEQHGFTTYQRIPFASLWGRGEQIYIVSAAERDRFIADFVSTSAVIVRQAQSDIVLAIILFGIFSGLYRAVFGTFAIHFELALLLIQLVMIITVENRRMKEVWDVPQNTMAGRAPAPFEPKRNFRLIKPIAQMTNGELGLTIFMGLICSALTGMMLTAERTPNFSAFNYYALLTLFGLIIALGIRCAVEGAKRLLGWTKTG